MITKREKLQYIYVFLTDLVVLLLSTLLAWLVTDGLLKQLVPYAPSDWVQTICLLMLAFVATFICFDQTENIVTRTSGEEIKLSIKFNVLLALVYSTAMLLTKAEMLDSRYFTLAVPLINFVLLPIAHGLLKRSLLQIQSQSGLESLVGLISTQDRAELLINELQRDWSKRISGVAILEAPASEIGSTLAGVPVTANYDNFMDWIRQAALDEIYVDIPMDSGESFIPVLEEMESMGLTVHFRLLLLDRIEERRAVFPHFGPLRRRQHRHDGHPGAEAARPCAEACDGHCRRSGGLHHQRAHHRHYGYPAEAGKPRPTDL